MRKFALCFALIIMLLSIIMLFSVLYFNFSLLLSGNKIALFTLINAIFLFGVSLFFFIFKDRVILYFENYKREKQI